MSGPLVTDIALARAFRGARKSERVRVGFPGGFDYFDSLDAALAAIRQAVEEGDRAFCIDIREPRTPPDETEPEHAQ